MTTVTKTPEAIIDSTTKKETPIDIQTEDVTLETIDEVREWIERELRCTD